MILPLPGGSCETAAPVVVPVDGEHVTVGTLVVDGPLPFPPALPAAD